MNGVLDAVTASGPVYRVACAPDPWALPDWSHARLNGAFANRWHGSEGEYRAVQSVLSNCAQWAHGSGRCGQRGWS